MKEEVIILFVKNKSILLESSEGNKKYSLPRIEVHPEHKTKEIYYLEYAFHKKVFDLFNGTVLPLKYEYSQTVKTDSKLCYLFFVYNWDSPHPIEQSGDESFKYKWLDINNADTEFENEDDRIINAVKETIRVKSILNRRISYSI